MSDDLKRATGLWEKQGKRGAYLSGAISEPIPAGARLLIFPNDRKTDGGNDPDWTLCYVDDSDQPPMQRAEPGTPEPERPAADDDEIPF